MVRRIARRGTRDGNPRLDTLAALTERVRVAPDGAGGEAATYSAISGAGVTLQEVFPGEVRVEKS
jgi:hypothetical protein